MTQQREPARWADPASDSDHSLRRLLQHAREDLGDAGLAARIEQAVQARAAAESCGAQPSTVEPTARMWRPWIGVATLLLGVTAAMFAARTPHTSAPEGREPAADSSMRSGGTGPSDTAANALPALQHNPPTPFMAKKPLNPGAQLDHRDQQAPSPAAASGRARASNHERSTAAKRVGTVGSRASRDSNSTAVGLSASEIARTALSGDRDDPSAFSRFEPPSASPSRAGTTGPARDAPNRPGPVRHAVPPELTLISAAQRALRTAPADALALAEQHKRAYPNGRFREEREEIAISALRALDQKTAARARAQNFLAEHPHALAAPRITRLLDAR